MKTQSFEWMPTNQLEQRKKLTNTALMLVCIGSAVAIAAAFYRFSISGDFPTATFGMALIALLASVPVWMERIRILKILRDR
ncbi:MAG: hypothetical protein AAFO07_22075 [Bacteroidota bacterium]